MGLVVVAWTGTRRIRSYRNTGVVRRKEYVFVVVRGRKSLQVTLQTRIPFQTKSCVGVKKEKIRPTKSSLTVETVCGYGCGHENKEC